MKQAAHSRREFIRMATAAAVTPLLVAFGAAAAPAGSVPPSSAPQRSSGAAASIAAAAKPAGSTPGLPGQRPLVVAYPTVNAANMPLWMADAIGAFKNRGLTIDMHFIQGDVAV